MPAAFRTALLALCAAAAFTTSAQAQGQAPLKVGLMLPATGTFAALGDMIERGFRLYVQEQNHPDFPPLLILGYIGEGLRSSRHSSCIHFHRRLFDRFINRGGNGLHCRLWNRGLRLGFCF